MRLFFLQTIEPMRRMFICLTAAFIGNLSPSGSIPGGMVESFGIEVKHRWWRRTRSHFIFLVKVLCRKREGLVVISGSLRPLRVICIHRMN
jgi:hypothetical protein